MAIYDVDPSYFNGLDADFLGKPDLLISVANWVDLLTERRLVWVYHPHDGINTFPDVGPPNYGTPMEDVATRDNRPDDLPLTDVDLNSFFDGARRLTGQQLNDIDHMFNVVANDWAELGLHIVSGAGDGQPGEFRAAMNIIFQSWHSSEAAKECADYVEAIIGYITEEQKRVSALADCLAAYAGIITNARRSLVSVMGGFVAAMGSQMATDAQVAAKENAQFITGAVSAIVGGAVSVVLGFPIGAVDAAKSLIGIAIALTNSAIQQSQGHPNSPMGGGYSGIARAYFAAVDKIFRDAQDGLLQKQAEMRAILAAPLNLPKPLFTTPQFDANGHRVMADS